MSNTESVTKGFKNSGMCPFTNAASPNVILPLDGFHISHNYSSAGYGCETTAIVLQNHVHFVLNGDHREALAKASEEHGLQGCVDYFIDNINQANRISEHLSIAGLREDRFNLLKMTLEMIGQANVYRITVAAKNLLNQV